MTISGKLGSEYHMWNIARLDGEWRYFDATSDRGRASYGFKCFNAAGEQMSGHTWDREWALRLTSSLSA